MMYSRGSLDCTAFSYIPSNVLGMKKSKIAQNRPTGRLIFISKSLLAVLNDYREMKTHMGIYRHTAWPLIHFTYHWDPLWP